MQDRMSLSSREKEASTYIFYRIKQLKKLVCLHLLKLSSRNVRNYENEVSPKWLSKYELNKDNNNRNINGDSRGTSAGLNLSQRTTGNKGMLRVGHVVFPREQHANWLANTK